MKYYLAGGKSLDAVPDELGELVARSLNESEEKFSQQQRSRNSDDES